MSRPVFGQRAEFLEQSKHTASVQKALRAME